MPTFNDKSGIEFNTLSEELTCSMLKDESNIKPKEDFPLVWYVGNKAVSYSEIEDLYKLAKMRKDQFEERMAEK